MADQVKVFEIQVKGVGKAVEDTVALTKAVAELKKEFAKPVAPALLETLAKSAADANKQIEGLGKTVGKLSKESGGELAKQAQTTAKAIQEAGQALAKTAQADEIRFIPDDQLDSIAKAEAELKRLGAVVKTASQPSQEFADALTRFGQVENVLKTLRAEFEAVNAASRKSLGGINEAAQFVDGSLGSLLKQQKALRNEFDQAAPGTEQFQQLATQVKTVEDRIAQVKTQAKSGLFPAGSIPALTQEVKQLQVALNSATSTEEAEALAVELERAKEAVKAAQLQAKAGILPEDSLERTKVELQQVQAQLKATTDPAQSAKLTVELGRLEDKLQDLASEGIEPVIEGSILAIKSTIGQLESSFEGAIEGSKEQLRLAVEIAEAEARIEVAKKQGEATLLSTNKELANAKFLAEETVVVAEKEAEVVALSNREFADRKILAEQTVVLLEVEAEARLLQNKAFADQKILAEQSLALAELEAEARLDIGFLKARKEAERLLATKELIAEQDIFPPGSIGKLESELAVLQEQLRDLPAGSKEFARVKDRIDDLNVSIEATSLSTRQQNDAFIQFGASTAGALAEGVGLLQSFGLQNEAAEKAVLALSQAQAAAGLIQTAVELRKQALQVKAILLAKTQAKAQEDLNTAQTGGAKATGLAGKAFGVFGKAIAANPLGLLLTAVAVIVPLLIGLEKRFNILAKVSDLAGKAFAKIGQIFEGVLAGAVEFVVKRFEKLGAIVDSVLSFDFSDPIGSIKEFGSAVLDVLNPFSLLSDAIESAQVGAAAAAKAADEARRKAVFEQKKAADAAVQFDKDAAEERLELQGATEEEILEQRKFRLEQERDLAEEQLNFIKGIGEAERQIIAEGDAEAIAQLKQRIANNKKFSDEERAAQLEAIQAFQEKQLDIERLAAEEEDALQAAREKAADDFRKRQDEDLKRFLAASNARIGALENELKNEAQFNALAFADEKKRLESINAERLSQVEKEEALLNERRKRIGLSLDEELRLQQLQNGERVTIIREGTERIIAAARAEAEAVVTIRLEQNARDAELGKASAESQAAIIRETVTIRLAALAEEEAQARKLVDAKVSTEAEYTARVDALARERVELQTQAERDITAAVQSETAVRTEIAQLANDIQREQLSRASTALDQQAEAAQRTLEKAKEAAAKLSPRAELGASLQAVEEYYATIEELAVKRAENAQAQLDIDIASNQAQQDALAIEIQRAEVEGKNTDVLELQLQLLQQQNETLGQQKGLIEDNLSVELEGVAAGKEKALADEITATLNKTQAALKDPLANFQNNLTNQIGGLFTKAFKLPEGVGKAVAESIVSDLSAGLDATFALLDQFDAAAQERFDQQLEQVAERKATIDEEISAIEERSSMVSETISALREQVTEAEGAQREAIVTQLADQINKQAEFNGQLTVRREEAKRLEAEEKKIEAQKAERDKAAEKRQKALTIVSQLATAAGLAQAAVTAFAPDPAAAAVPFGVGLAIRIANAVAFVVSMVSTVAGLANAIKSAEGSVLPEFGQGGLLSGPSHAQGGILMIHKATKKPMVEAEGGEVVLTKNVSKSPKLLSIASMVNEMGGGKRLAKDGAVLKTGFGYFADGGVVPAEDLSGLSANAVSVASNAPSAADFQAFATAIANRPTQVSVVDFNLALDRTADRTQAATVTE